jgi:hypothetical protein
MYLQEQLFSDTLSCNFDHDTCNWKVNTKWIVHTFNVRHRAYDNVYKAGTCHVNQYVSNFIYNKHAALPTIICSVNV